jgi:superfamily II DNA or RNA helicase
VVFLDGYGCRVGSVIDELQGFDLANVSAAVGATSFKRGQAYARGRRVLSVGWDSDRHRLTGSVIGHGLVYSTTASFSKAHGELKLVDGECSCPVGRRCKHVAALVITATDEPRRGRFAPVSPSARPPAPPPVQALSSWEKPLRALIETPELSSTGAPLAIELAVPNSGHAGGGAPRLKARLMRPGARGGWVNGSLTWTGLDSWQGQSGEYRADQIAALRELHAAQQASDSRRSYYYSYATEKALDLSDCSAQLWPLLDEALRLGVTLIHPRAALGEVPCSEGEVALDVSGAEAGGAVVQAILRLRDDPVGCLEPVLFLGRDGHGLVCTEPDDARDPRNPRLRLVRLARPAPMRLQRLLLEREHLAIPASDVERFADEISPALQRIATLISSDGSFTPPEISVPGLVLQATYGDDHRLEVAWEWVYTVGATPHRIPLGASGPAFRDRGAEHAILATSRIADADLRRFGLVDDAGRPAAAAVTLTGLDSLHLTTAALPRLAELPGLTVKVTGEPAEYRDVGESLEIAVSTEDRDGERDWFDLGVTIRVDGRELPFAPVFTALANGETQMLLPDGAHFSLLEPRLQSLRELIDEARALAERPSQTLRISRYQASLWAELAALGVVAKQAQGWQRQISALLELDSIAEHALPATLSAELRPYQVEGFGWLATLWNLELGGILADDMGLGKTVQALALVCHAREHDPGLGAFLVVAPTSVVPGWVGEAARFAPGLNVAAVADTFAKSGRTVGELAQADIVVTTYTLLRLDAGAYRSVSWAGVILDEAQYVKNHQALTYRCVRELAAPFKLAITGTPMENNLTELWSLLSITAPGLFPDPKRFAKEYARPIERGGDAERLARLRRRIKPLVKRRTKELVARELPAKQQQTLEIDLHPRHRKLYDTYLQRERQKILGLLGDFDRNRFTIFRSITLLRQLSLHAGLADPEHEAIPCAKLDALVEQLGDVIGSGHRALVFSQFTGFLAKARASLEHGGIAYSYLDGRTRKRERVLDDFKNGSDPVFLISLKAGGFGLNLTEADYCFLLDPWWNPATENQAIDRIHRIGQTRQVMVYRLLARGTIEEKVVALAQRKAALFHSVLDDGGLFANSMTADDIRGLID